MPRALATPAGQTSPNMVDLARTPSTRMTKTPGFTPPKQARSRATVEALLEATAQVLADVGYAKASTNRIAKRAGVSVGSLYQYFRDKEALVRALVERHIAEQGETLQASLRDLAGLPLEDAVRGVVRRTVEIRQQDRALVRVLYMQLPQYDDFDLLREWRRGSAKAIEFASLFFSCLDGF